jgi:thiosulfate reductase cytochrome b subunit
MAVGAVGDRSPQQRGLMDTPMTFALSPSDEMAAPPQPKREKIYRHSRVVRITHWINALCLFFLLTSGMQIFNAHPALYWGQKGFAYDRTAFISIQAERIDGRIRGMTRVGPLALDTTGVLGYSPYNGEMQNRGFPAWATIPSWRDLASGRRWHFFFAWLFAISGAVYIFTGFRTRHIQRDLAPTLADVAPQNLLHEVRDHLQLKFPKGEAAKRYNALQKIAYFGTAIVLLPTMVLTGLTMSPGMNAALPFLLDLFGGRQSARTIHFICASLIVAFIVVHLVMVLISGVGNNLRSMITGRYEIEPESK